MLYWLGFRRKIFARAIISSSIIWTVICIIISNNAGAANKNGDLTYSNLFRQIFERSFFFLETGRAFYFPFQMPQCRSIRDNNNNVDVTIREDVEKFIMYTDRLRGVAANVDKYLAVFEDFVANVRCDPFFIDLTEQGISQDGRSFEFSITYYKQISGEKIKTALEKVSGLVAKSTNLEIDGRLNRFLRQNLPYGKDDVIRNLLEWDALEVDKIALMTPRCDHIFGECTMIVKVDTKSKINNTHR